MIFDRIENLFRHELPQADAVVSFLRANNVLKIPVGEIEINGRELFVRPSEYETKKPEEGKFETHRVYADLQFVVQGSEIMQTAPADVLEPLTEYDPKGDYQFFKASRDIASHLVHAGEFAIFWPNEAHRPCCSPQNTPVKVKKLVFKVRIS